MNPERYLWNFVRWVIQVNITQINWAHSLLGYEKLARYLIAAIVIAFLILPPSLADYPRCISGCTAEDITDVTAYMVETSTPGTYDILIDFRQKNDRQKVLVVFDVYKDTTTSVIIDGYKCLECPISVNKWVYGAKIASITFEAGHSYTLANILFQWDTSGACGCTNCNPYSPSKCKSDFGSVAIHPPPILAIDDHEICLGDSVTLDLTVSGATGGSGYSYSWTPLASGLSCYDCQDPIATPQTTKTYTVKVTDIAWKSYSTEDVVVTVSNPPTADFSATPLSGCAPLTVTFTDASSAPSGSFIRKWEWDFNNDGTIDRIDSTAPAPFTHDYTVPGTYSVTLKVTTDKGCKNTKLKTITVNPLPVCTITALPAVCAGSTANTASVADAGAGATYAWEITGGTITSTTPYKKDITWTAGSSGTAILRVTVTTAAGCTVPTCSKNVPILNNPIVSAGNDLDVCDDVGSVSLEGSNSGGSATYLWTTTGTGTFSPNPAISLSEQYTPSAADIAAGHVTITLTATGCSVQSVDTMLITIWIIPAISLEALIS